METPHRPPRGAGATYTHHSEIDSPTSKRARKAGGDHNPPLHQQDAGAQEIGGSAASAVQKHLQQRKAREDARQRVILDFAGLADHLKERYTGETERVFAEEIKSAIVRELIGTLKDDAELKVRAAPAVRVQAPASREKTSGNGRTYAGIAKTPTDTRSFDLRKVGHTAPLKNMENARDACKILAAITQTARLDRQDTYMLRKELCTKVTDLTLKNIPNISETPTGWAVTLDTRETRERLLNQENIAILKNVLQAQTLVRPQKWFNYAVPEVPAMVTSLIPGEQVDMKELVQEEAEAQTGVKPVDVRPSKYGPNVQNNTITWIVSFTTEVKSFRLFNRSRQSHLVLKSIPVRRHEDGCQGYCIARFCQKARRCANCGEREMQHIGPLDGLCHNKAQCANCHGPFRAGHEGCPAAVIRKDGRIKKPTRKELASIRQYGDKSFRAACAPPPAETLSPTSSQDTIAVEIPTTTRKRKGDRIREYEEANKGPSSQISRPRRAVATPRNMNIVEMANSAFGTPNVEMNE